MCAVEWILERCDVERDVIYAFQRAICKSQTEGALLQYVYFTSYVATVTTVTLQYKKEALTVSLVI